jgi:hypothetical protein
MSFTSISLLTVIIFGLSLTIPTLLVYRISKAFKSSTSLNDTALRGIVLYFIIWFTLSNYFGNSNSISLVPLLLMGFIPLCIGIIALLKSKNLRDALKVINPSWLVRIQLYRMLGFIFLYLYFKEGFVSRGFALFAGIGDILIGFTAVLVAKAVAKNFTKSYSLGIFWNILGIIDLILAPASAVLFGSEGLRFYPLVLVPLFIGPPLSILIHIGSLRNIFLHRRSKTAALA